MPLCLYQQYCISLVCSVCEYVVYIVRAKTLYAAAAVRRDPELLWQSESDYLTTVSLSVLFSGSLVRHMHKPHTQTAQRSNSTKMFSRDAELEVNECSSPSRARPLLVLSGARASGSEIILNYSEEQCCLNLPQTTATTKAPGSPRVPCSITRVD
jgi:hypothetical protein